MKINKFREAGFTLVEIMIVVSIVGLLSAIAVPNFVQSRTKAQRDACINNLRQLDGAMQQWALETKKNTTDAPDPNALATYLRSGVLPKCPAGEVPYVFGATVGDPVSCGNVGTLPEHALP